MSEAFKPESIQELIPTPEEKECLRVLWKSYEFAQGKNLPQRIILEKIREYYDEPLKLDTGRMQAIFSKMVKAPDPRFPKHNVHKLQHTDAHMRVNEKTIENEMNDGFIKCVQVLNNETSPSSDAHAALPLELDIIRIIWEGDSRYLIENNSGQGRPGRNVQNPDTVNTTREPYFSFGVHYLLRNESTHNEKFNMLIKELREIPLESYPDYVLKMILPVIEKYNATHETNKVDDDTIKTIQTRLDTMTQK